MYRILGVGCYKSSGCASLLLGYICDFVIRTGDILFLIRLLSSCLLLGVRDAG